MYRHSTNEVVMIEPIGFRFNVETAVNNIYQNNDDTDPNVIQEKAILEFWTLVKKLEERGVKVHVLKDSLDPETPDSIFPNNWFSTHEGGLMVIYPMFAKNRQAEIGKFSDKVENIADQAQSQENIFTILDYSRNRSRGEILEGTGSLVIDRKNKVAYCALSPRSNFELLERWGRDTGHKIVPFTAYQEGKIIYHTNILMGIGEKNALVALETINKSDRTRVKESLEAGGNSIIELREDQLSAGLGNTLELEDSNGQNFIVMSQQAYNVLTEEQREAIEAETDIVSADIGTIEYYGGGSARCMIAEIF